jgi:hypothetical protein
VVAAGFEGCERAQTDLDGLVQADRPVCEHRKEHNAVGDAVSSGPAVPSWSRERRGRPTAATDDFTASQGFARDRCSQAPGLLLTLAVLGGQAAQAHGPNCATARPRLDLSVASPGVLLIPVVQPAPAPKSAPKRQGLLSPLWLPRKCDSRLGYHLGRPDNQVWVAYGCFAVDVTKGSKGSVLNSVRGLSRSTNYVGTCPVEHGRSISAKQHDGE